MTANKYSIIYEYLGLVFAARLRAFVAAQGVDSRMVFFISRVNRTNRAEPWAREQAPDPEPEEFNIMSGASLRGVVKSVGVWVRERSVINHNDNSLWDGATKSSAPADTAPLITSGR